MHSFMLVINSFAGHNAVHIRLNPPTKCLRSSNPRPQPVPNHPQMPPFSSQSDATSDLDLPPFIECNNNPWTGSPCTILFIFFILVFYALALWDRWLILKLRESEKLRPHNNMPPSYGATQNNVVRLPSVTITPAARSDDRKVFHNQKGGTSPSHLAPPSIQLNESPMLCVPPR
ncbi:hypothetical protein FB451DRAFT_1262552, partial [Mycena latifolia]